MSTRQRRSALLLSAATGLFGWVVVAAPPASASCAPDTPEPSPHAFVGRVIATESSDRVATVRTADGETVQVIGTPLPEGEISATTVDSTYVVGATYEFHPNDDTDPYEDICTATERLRGDDIPASLRGVVNGADVRPAPETGRDIAAAGAIAGGVAVVGVGAAAVWLRRRGDSRVSR